MVNRLPILFFLFLCMVTVGSAQPQVEHIHHWSYKEGLSDRTAWHTTIDSKGFLWIATGNGLNRYLGNGFEIFDNNPYSRRQIYENNIQQVHEINGHQLVLLNNRKEHFFEVFNLSSFTSTTVQLSEENGLSGTFKAVYVEELGHVYALTEEGASFGLFKMNSNNVFEEIGSFTFRGKKKAGETSFIRTRDGKFWVIDSENGLTGFSPASHAIQHFGLQEIDQLTSPSQSSYFTFVLHEDASGILWVAFPFRNGLLQLLPGAGQLHPALGFPTDELYSKAWEDEQGQLLFGAFLNYGLLKNIFFVGNDRQPIEAKWILEQDNKINHIYGKDFTKSMFISTHVGVYHLKMKDNPIRWLLADRQLSDGEWSDGISIRSITGDGEGNIYIARELKAWYRYNLATRRLDTIQVTDKQGKPISMWCNSNVVYDPAGFLWGGSCAGDRSGLLHRYRLKDGVTSTFPIPNKVISHILRLENGELLLASGAEDADGLLLFFDPAKEIFTPYTNIDGSNPLVGRKPQFIHYNQRGEIWVGTNEGLVYIDRKAKVSKLYNRSNSQLTNDNILAIHQSDHEELFLGTYGGLNILHLHSDEVTHYNIDHGLCNNTVCGILPDGTGNYFLSTFYGLSYFDTSQKLFSNFYQEKGLTFNEFNRLAFFKDQHENYYFGTLNGINIFQREELLGTTEKAQPLQWIKISKYTESGDKQMWEHHLSDLNKIKLQHNDDYIRFEFMLPYFCLPGQNKYAAKLIGLDDHWRLLEENPYFQVSRPPPGSYQLKIKAAPAEGHWMKEELSLDIQVSHAFYQRTWFLVSLPFIVLILSYFTSVWYVNRIRQQQEHQTRINKKFAELELQALQSQMNPHFVFNALGAVQYFIQNNNARAADSFLAKFAKLMRMFLESSKNKYISLYAELEMLSLYCELEQMRYDKKFDFNISVGKTIDTHNRELPSILIQPFVENAINHGLFHKKEKGQLSIEFEEDHLGNLTCSIKDDGVGRVKADQIKQQTNRTHKSRGMQIVRERLEVLQQVDEIKIAVTVEDLHPEREDKGTVVTIKIPELE